MSYKYRMDFFGELAFMCVCEDHKECPAFKSSGSVQDIMIIMNSSFILPKLCVFCRIRTFQSDLVKLVRQQRRKGAEASRKSAPPFMAATFNKYDNDDTETAF